MGAPEKICCLGLLLGLWRPGSSAAAPYSPPDVDFDKVEIWPLSGGVSSGVSVTLTAAGVDTGAEADDSTIDFLTKDYKVALRYKFNVALGLLERSAFVGDEWLTWEDRGGFPIDHTAKFSMSFLSTRGEWQITIGDKRMPWFDFSHKTAEPVVYAAVSTNLKGLVVDKRLECTVTCNPEECMDANGNAACGDTGSDTDCLARVPVAGNPVAATCTKDTKTGATEHMNCCDGWQQKTLPLVDGAIDEQYLNQMVKVHDDAEHVKRACKSFGAEEAEVVKCGQVAGSEVKVESIEKIHGTCTASSAKITGNVMLPADILAPLATQQQGFFFRQ